MKNILLILLFVPQVVLARDLTLYFLPSVKGMDWSTPKDIFTSFIKNRVTFKTLPYGHAWVGLNCKGTEELTGTSSEKLDYINQLVLGQKGFGIFYHSYEGKLEASDDILKKMKDVEERMNFLRVQVNEAQCKRITQYLNEYREKNVGRHFGPALRPRMGEGSNSASFAVSFLDVLDLLDEEMKLSWVTQVGLPLELSGLPLRNENVGFFAVWSHGDSWAKPEEKQVPLTLWNIDKMYAWVNKKIKEPRDLKVETVGRMRGIALDKSHLPAPAEPIWEQVIDPKSKKTIQSPSTRPENSKNLSQQK